jgi:hypothetical protein
MSPERGNTNRGGVTPEGFKLPVPPPSRPEVGHDKKPKQETKPLQEEEVVKHKSHKTAIKVGSAITAVTIALGAYAYYPKEVNAFFSGLINSDPAEPTPTPTKAVDEYVVPEGLGVEDTKVRKSVEVSMENSAMKNPFGLDVTEVKNYLLTGETKEFKTFEVLNDANNKPAFVVVKGGDNGFDEQKLASVENAINKLNQIDSTMVSTMRDKSGLIFISADVNNANTFEKYPTYGATYDKNIFGGYILINQKYMDSNNDVETFNTMGLLLTESRALYTTKFLTGYKNGAGIYSIGGYTNASDRLDEKIGIDKGLYIISFVDKWFNDNLITKIEKLVLKGFGDSAVAYYSKN